MATGCISFQSTGMHALLCTTEYDRHHLHTCLYTIKHVYSLNGARSDQDYSKGADIIILIDVLIIPI